MSRIAAFIACVLGALAAAGCAPGEPAPPAAAEISPAKLEDERNRLQATVDEQARQIRTLQALGEKRLELLYHVQRIELGRHTGGVNLDDRPGDEAIRVYVRPIDQHGSVIKAAGELRIKLFDLAAEEPHLIGSYAWSVEELARHWAGGFLSHQYRVDCPWPAGPPAHDEITVRVEFTDYLTGKTFTAQTVCRIVLPAGKR